MPLENFNSSLRAKNPRYDGFLKFGVVFVIAGFLSTLLLIGFWELHWLRYFALSVAAISFLAALSCFAGMFVISVGGLISALWRRSR